MKEKRKQKYDDVLMAALDFDETDLEVNRQGEMSNYQFEELKKALIRIRTMAWMAVLIAIMLTLGSLGEGRIASIAVGLLCIFVGRVLYRLVANEWQSICNDLQKGNVSCITGCVHLDVSDDQRFRIGVEDETFDVEKSIFLAFKNKEYYQIYYLPETRKIVSAEHLI